MSRIITICVAGMVLVGALIVHGAVGPKAVDARGEVNITFGNTGCTEAGSVAQEVFVTNSNSGRKINATIEITTYRGVNQDKSQTSVIVPAGGRVKLGC